MSIWSRGHRKYLEGDFKNPYDRYNQAEQFDLFLSDVGILWLTASLLMSSFLLRFNSTRSLCSDQDAACSAHSSLAAVRSVLYQSPWGPVCRKYGSHVWARLPPVRATSG